MTIPQYVKIVEVGPRDGLQNEKAMVPTDVKVALINRLTDAGFVNIEAASFVAEVGAADGRRRRRDGPHYAAPRHAVLGADAEHEGLRGRRCRRCRRGGDLRRGQRGLLAEEHQLLDRRVDRPLRTGGRCRQEAGVRLRGSISCALGCPYQGEVSVHAVVDVVRRLRELGCDEIDIADTIGVGTPTRVQEVMRAAAAEFSIDRLSGHFHDTYGQALSNILASLEVGIAIFHASVAGLGGCPYAKGATGNVATEDVLYMLHGMGLHTGIELDDVVRAGDFISQAIGRANSSRVGRALLTKWASQAGDLRVT
jgi:hydroxymethylglutaryl-CoA lyase